MNTSLSLFEYIPLRVFFFIGYIIIQPVGFIRKVVLGEQPGITFIQLNNDKSKPHVAKCWR